MYEKLEAIKYLQLVDNAKFFTRLRKCGSPIKIQKLNSLSFHAYI